MSDYQGFPNNKIRNLTLLVLALVTFIIILVLAQSLTKTGKTPVNFIIAPSDASITLNGEKISKGVVYVSPGTHTLKVTRDNFSLYEEPLNVGEDALTVPVGLLPINAKGERIMNDDSAFLEFEGVDGEKARDDGLAFEEANPIVSHLPYRSGLFNIDYRLKDDSDTEIVLVVTVHELEKEYPQKKIRDWGFDPNSFEIEYRGWW